MAVITDIAEAVKDELNGASLSQEFTAERCYQPAFELAEMKTLHVTVVPKGMTVEPASRSLIQDDYQIDVAVQKKLNAADNAELDELMGLVEEIGDFFRRRRLDAVPDAVCVKIENVPIYAPEHISELRGFTSILTLTFRVLR